MAHNKMYLMYLECFLLRRLLTRGNYLINNIIKLKNK